MNEFYQKQVRLLLDILPELVKLPDFALKGGTALNFFWHNMPRLSVDIDLVYLPIKNRNDSLQNIKEGLSALKRQISDRFQKVDIQHTRRGGAESRLVVRTPDAQIKIEVNTVIRGAIFQPEKKELCEKAQEMFQQYTENQSLSYEDLYGGKLCAALDRQHPRDLFDISQLMNRRGLTTKIIHAFIGYLISHSRPMNELLNPNLKEISAAYEAEFAGMTVDPVEPAHLDSLLTKLPKLIAGRLSNKEKEFIIRFKEGEPDWNLIPITPPERFAGCTVEA